MSSLFLLIALLHHCTSFNIDTNIPVVRQSDQPGSYFGFSVAQHQWVDKRRNTVHNWVLVGAPKANVSAMPANIVNPGAVYKCELTKTTCEQIPFDTSGNALHNGRIVENKSNQWFGVSLYSSGLDGTVLACAHRYLYYGELANYHIYPGKCFSSSKKLNINRDKYVYDRCKKINDKEARKEVRDVSLASYLTFQYCQMGVSAIYIPEKDATLFGAPGSMNYQGLLFYQENEPDLLTAEIQNTSAPLGYQGFSTSIGMFFKKSQIDAVTGAPRYNHHGMVVVFEKTGPVASPTFLPKKVILIPAEAKGPRQPGTGFGYSVAGVDVNNDSWTDVIVGAPFYSMKNSPNEGRVFVYLNKGDGTFVKQVELAPSISKKGAYFGHVVSVVGDLDKDGYQDFAVGAPYEDGSGVVYIYNGSADGVSKKPAQIIKGSVFKRNLKTFGYSIAGRLDMDQNGYPDLLIGAYASDSIVMLRSRPIIEIMADIKISPNPFNIRNKNCTRRYKGKDIKTVCIQLQICLMYKEREDIMQENLSVDLSVESDVKYTKSSPRVIFTATGGPQLNKTLTNSLPLHPKKECFVEEVILRENVDDIYPDITFQINYKMHEPSSPPTAAPGSLPSLKEYAMLEEGKKSFSVAVLKFKRDCDKCEPNLHIASNSPDTLAVGEKDYVVEVTIINTGESAYNTELLVTIPEGVTQSSVLDATDPVKEPFSISHRSNFTAKHSDNSTTHKILVDNPMKTSSSKRIKVLLNTESFTKSQDFLPIKLEVTSSNREQPQNMKDNIIILNVTIVSRADLDLLGSTKTEQISYGGEVVGESAMIREDDVGSEVRHTYIVHNKGPDLVPEAEIIIQWPFETKSGKHLLYLMGVEIGGRGECFFLPGQVNLLGLVVEQKSVVPKNTTVRAISGSKGARRRRAVTDDENENTKKKRQTSEAAKRKPSAELDCKLRTARCTPIRCTMKRLVKGDQVTFNVRSRIWNGTLLEDYYGEEVEVISRASVNPAVTFVQELNPKNNKAEVRTQFYPDFPPPPSEKLADWVIPVAVVGAILALALIVLVLWKLGFFKRKKFDGNITEDEIEAIMAESKKEKNANAET